MGKPDGGMFSIKVVSSDLFDYPNMTDDFDGTDRLYPVMNFSRDGRGPSIAANIPFGHRSLVYVAGHQKFVWAIEYIGTIADGERAARLHGVYDPDPKVKFGSIFLPIRHLARVDLASAPTRVKVAKDTGILFNPSQKTIQYISAEDYHKIYNAIPWQWTIADGLWTATAPLPPAQPPQADSAATPNGGTTVPPKPPQFILPPVLNAESLLARIRHVHEQGMPERNMEDVVKAFLIALGHLESAISFQVGHVDVRVNDERGKGRIILEVKRSLRNENTRQDALRKGFDYASRHGAPLVVVTDADIYEVYDRSRGMDYDSMCCGRFQLTRFAAADQLVMDLLRPTNT